MPTCMFYTRGVVQQRIATLFAIDAQCTWGLPCGLAFGSIG
jgi:hypothetical protein